MDEEDEQGEGDGSGAALPDDDDAAAASPTEIAAMFPRVVWSDGARLSRLDGMDSAVHRGGDGTVIDRGAPAKSSSNGNFAFATEGLLATSPLPLHMRYALRDDEAMLAVPGPLQLPAGANRGMAPRRRASVVPTDMPSCIVSYDWRVPEEGGAGAAAAGGGNVAPIPDAIRAIQAAADEALLELAALARADQAWVGRELRLVTVPPVAGPQPKARRGGSGGGAAAAGPRDAVHERAAASERRPKQVPAQDQGPLPTHRGRHRRRRRRRRQRPAEATRRRRQRKRKRARLRQQKAAAVAAAAAQQQ